MSDYLINFETLKFNLYEILNIAPDATETKIKKAYRNLILNFHPDKNNKTEEEIYYHIITANEVLTNTAKREKYDNYLIKKVEDHFDLKNVFNKVTNNREPINTKEESAQLFNNKMLELNIKHNISDKSLDTKKTYETIVKERENKFIIPKENINDTTDFNLQFENKKNNKLFGDQLITKPENMKITSINTYDNYTSLDVAFDNLYIEDTSISTTKYTSLDTAFKIQEINTNIANIDIDSAMKNYKNQSNIYTNPNFEFSKVKYDEW